MTRRKILLILIGIVMVHPLYGGAEGIRSWRNYFFDGAAFQEGMAESGPSVYTKEGYFPSVRMKEEPLREEKLPPGTGGLVVLGYIQSAGGKLQNQSGSIPLASAVIEIRNGGRTMALRSNGDGYALLALPAGKYDIQIQGFTQKALVEKGKTTFMAIRAGKRMVD